MKLPMKKRNGERGQSFVELAISIIFLLTLLTVMIDLGWAYYTLVAMRDAAQEAASYAAICPSFDGVNNPADYIRPRLKLSAAAPINMNDITDIKIEDVDSNGNTGAAIDYGNNVRITMKVDHQIIVPFAATFIGTTHYPLTVTVTDAILRLGTVTECAP